MTRGTNLGPGAGQESSQNGIRVAATANAAAGFKLPVSMERREPSPASTYNLHDKGYIAAFVAATLCSVLLRSSNRVTGLASFWAPVAKGKCTTAIG